MMNNKLMNLLGLAVMFVLVAFGLSHLSSAARIDLTQQKLYTLSDGTRHILADLKEPVALELYFSQSASKDLMALRAYSQRVQELLNEYELASGGKLSVKVIDPEPFSEEEDQAAAQGLQGVPVGNGNDTLYFGLVARAQVPVVPKPGAETVDDIQPPKSPYLKGEGKDQAPAAAEDKGGAATTAAAGKAEPPRMHEQTAQLPFLQPEREAFLEYEITKLIYQVQQTRPVVIGLLSGLDVRGGFDMATGGPKPAWASVDQLDGLYEVRSLAANVTAIDPDINVLMLVQPPELTDDTLYAIDQFAMRGGRVLAFIDPVTETSQGGMMGMPERGSATSLNKLLSSWGVDWNPDQVVLDADHGLVVRQGQGLPPARHLGLLSLDRSSMEKDDVVTAQLESVNMGSVGHFTAHAGATTHFEPWLMSSNNAMLTDANRLRVRPDLMALQRDFKATGDQYALAVRLSGDAQSAFADGVKGHKVDGHLASTDKLAVTLVADTDVLSDRLWVQVQQFFGQRILSPWADNGNLLVNLADHLGGSADLISLRARGQYSRPFERVEDLRHTAEQRFLASEKRLQQELEETEHKLADLQQKRDGDNGVLTLSGEQQQALEGFQQKKLEIRKELRNVQHELDKDIDALGTRLKIINIFVMPVLFTLLLGLAAWWRRRTQKL